MSLFNPTQESFAWPTSDTQEEEQPTQEDVNDTQPEALPDDAEDLPYSSSTSSSEDSYSDVPDRPNRWRGTRKKLDKYYANERTLLDSISALDDDDLSMHLYNVHGLKRGIYPDFSTTNGASKDEHKDWMRKERLLESSGEWYPHRSWTQWPLEPAVVPRGDERGTWMKKHHGDAEGARKEIARRLELRPSHDLEELLLAEFTKQARVTFEAREWNTETARSDDDRTLSESAPPISRNRSAHSANAPTTSDHERDSRKRRKLAPAMSPSLTQGVRRRAGPEGALKPVATGDDEYARSIAAPIINSCIANLDSLLRGLHHSRVNHMTFERVSKTSGRSGLAANAGTSDTENEGSSSDSQNGSRRQKSRFAERYRPHPRDWSEVLGMAALVGWDPVIVQRAQERCQRLFAESMVFQNLDNGPYDIATPSVGQGGEGEGEVMSAGVHLDGFMQPIKRGAKTGNNKRKEKQKQPRAAAGRSARTSTSADPTDQTQAEDEETRQAATTSTAPAADTNEDSEDHICKDCGTTSTPLWRLQGDESWLCNSCHLYFRKHKRHKGNVRDEDRRRNREAARSGETAG